MARSATGRMIPPTIVVRVRPLEETRTPNNGCIWLAECEVEGRRFEARSRHGAANALARELVAAGFADRPLEVHAMGSPAVCGGARLGPRQGGPIPKETVLSSASDGSLLTMPCRLSERLQNRGSNEQPLG